MASCKKCNVEIIDNTNVCPLCDCVIDNMHEYEEIYPDIRLKTKKMFLVTKIYLFVAIILQIIAFYIDYKLFNEIKWSIYSGIFFAYIYMLLRYVFLHTAGYRTKIFVVITVGLICAYFVDLISGYKGWSISLALPICEIAFTILILLCIIINNKSWQSYIILQIINLVICVFHLILWKINLIGYDIISLVALFMSVSLFLGTVIIGGDRAMEELKRRFMI